MHPDTFKEIYSIMEASFPDTEIRTYEGQKELLLHPSYQLVSERDDSGVLIAILAGWDFPGFRFIEHLAVHPDARSSGVGGRLLRAYTSASPKPAILEVEPPVDDLTRRRIAFYERCGFLLTSIDYVQPPLRVGQNPLPLRIMSCPRLLTPAEFSLYQKTLYTEVYKV